MKIVKAVLFTLILSSTAFATEYAVVSNKNMRELSKAQIKAVFLKKITIINNVKIVPISLGTRDPLRSKFEKKVLNMSFSRLKSYWTKQHYLGHRPPLSMKSQESIKAFVKKIDGAIGYIQMSNLDDSLKVIYRWRD